MYPGSGLSGEVEKHPGDAPDSGYIAIVTILVATLLVVVLTVVSQLSRLESFYVDFVTAFECPSKLLEMWIVDKFRKIETRKINNDSMCRAVNFFCHNWISIHIFYAVYELIITNILNSDAIQEFCSCETTFLSSYILSLIIGLFHSQLAVFVYRHYVHKNLTSINFDNPVYRKTTEDQVRLKKTLSPIIYPSTVGEELRALAQDCPI